MVLVAAVAGAVVPGVLRGRGAFAARGALAAGAGVLVAGVLGAGPGTGSPDGGGTARPAE